MSRAVALCCTLRWRPLRRLVAGVDLPARSAILPFHRTVRTADPAGPSLGPGRGIPVEVVRPGPEARARLEFYAAVDGYAPIPSMLEDREQVDLYAPAEPVLGRPDWSLECWRAAHGDIALAAAPEVMDYMGEPPAAVAARLPGIHRRAQARLRALPGADRRAGVEVIERTRPYGNFYTVEEYALRHPLAGGGRSQTVRRAVFHGFDAAIVLPWDPRRGRVLLLEQFRIAPFARGDADPWSLEPVAGLIDPGESAEDAARREAREEAGIEICELIRVGAAYPSPGNSTEFHHHFVAACDLPDGAAGSGGLAEEGEDIVARLMPEETLFAEAGAGRLRNAPLTLLALWLEGRAPALRARLARDGAAS